MIKNNLKIAWRNLLYNKLFSTLNIFGLAIGISVSILLSLFIIQERSFDDFANRDKIFRYLAHINYDGSKEIWAGVPNAVGPTVKDNIPEVTLSARTLLNGFGDNANISIGDESYLEARLYWADPDLVEIFDLDFIHGNKQTALNDPDAILLSESKAKQYFGEENPVNKTIELNRTKTLKVTGVYADFPATSTFDADLIGPFIASGFGKGITWDNASFETWIMVGDPADRQKVEAYLPKMIKEHVGDDPYYTLSTQPLTEVHLNSSGVNSYSERKGDANQLRQLSYLAVALLLIAAINYMNLATARAQQRSKEVGVSKTLGASKKGLISKFYAETALLTFVSIVIGLGFAVLGIPLFSLLSGKTLLYSTLLDPVFLMGLPLLWLIITLISGLYPAMILSSYSPIEALQKGKNVRTGSALFRRALVVLQFSASVILIVGVIVMYIQMDYITQRELGYNPENVLAIKMNALKGEQEFEALKNNVRDLSSTQQMAVAQAFPGKGENSASIHKDHADTQGAMIHRNRVTGDILEVLQLNLLAGRMVKEWTPGDTTSEGKHLIEIVLNKQAVDYLGFTPEDAIGKKTLVGMGDNCYIVGVVDNFNYSSLHNSVGAYTFTNAPYFGLPYLLVRFKTGDLRETLRQYEAAYKKVAPNAPFDYTFLDSRLETLYVADKQIASVLFAFSGLAIFVGCLGLFGLAAFTAERRTKEIGVRKVLGATVPALVRLLSIDFIKLVLVAFLIACPVAYWGFGKWLNNFAYRIDMKWWMFGLAGMVALVIAIFTVSSQAIRAAIANPVDSLRDE